MKKVVLIILTLVLGIAIGGTVAIFTNMDTLLLGKSDAVTTFSVSSDSNAALVCDAYTIVDILEKRDYTALSEWVHPVEGIYFTPYSTVVKEENQHFQADTVKNFGTSSTIYDWGMEDGSGAPISLTPSQYFERFVYDYDFIKAEQIGINSVVRSGNSLENVKDVFPDAEFVEFHFPGSEEYGQIDWESLKLVFEDYNGKRKLIAIIHSQWTV